jgi:ribose 1,5-bisphosphokinase PhnN
MDEAVERARVRLAKAAAGGTDQAAVDSALERAREALQELAATADSLESSLPIKVEEAVGVGLREQLRPSARHLAEVRGLMNQVIRRLERIEGDVLSERHARIDDLALLVDLVASGWQSVNERLARIEEALAPQAKVVTLDDHRADSG